MELVSKCSILSKVKEDKILTTPRGIGFAFHRAGAEIGQKWAF